MPSKLTRREFAAALGTAALATAAIAQDAKKAATKPTEAEILADADFKSLESKLTKPLPAKLKGLAKTALTTSRNNYKERMKFPLPEGSEPCTTFAPEPARSRER